MSKSVKKVTGAVSGLSPLGMASDLLLGKKDPGVASGFTQLDPIQQKALGKYDKLMDTDTDGIARSMVSNQERQIRGNAMDLERKASQLSSQRGLGNSSVGLNAILNSTRDMGDKIGAARASLPKLQYDLRANNLNMASSGINNLLNSRAYIQGTPGGGRKGGLAPLVGMGVGAAFGGPAGASIGGGIGSALTQMG